MLTISSSTARLLTGPLGSLNSGSTRYTKITFVSTIEMMFPVPYRITSGPADIVIDGNLFQSGGDEVTDSDGNVTRDGGGIRSVTPPQIFASISTNEYQITLLKSPRLTRLLNEFQTGIAMNIKVYLVGPRLTDYPDYVLLQYGGFMSGYAFNGLEYLVSSTGDLLKLNLRQSRTTTNSTQQRKYPGDTAFDQIQEVNDQILGTWGR